MIRTLAVELGKLREPRTLLFGVISGYALTACFAILCGAAVAAGVLPWHWMFGALLGAKLVTNTLALVGLKLDVLALELGALNTAMDLVVMTGAIWATGDTGSPLLAIYVIEITVLALLTNLTATLLAGGLAIVLYAAMAILVAHGALPTFAMPIEWSGRSSSYLALSFAFVAFVIAAPTFYVAGILRRLRDRERALEQRTAELVEAGKQKAQFMANVTHELRTPLQGVIGLSDLVAKGIYGDTSERQRKAMAEVKASARRLLGMIDDLLELTKHDAGKLELALGQVEPGELLTAVIASAQWLLGGKQLDLRLELAGEVAPLDTDRGKLNQIVLNLLANAIKFTPDGGVIVVRARSHDDVFELEVTDTGIGIPADELDRVFDEFHQVDGTTSREYGGVGLGLALVKRLCHLLGGSVAVTSELGRGTTFTVQLPRVAPGAGSGDYRLRAG